MEEKRAMTYPSPAAMSCAQASAPLRRTAGARSVVRAVAFDLWETLITNTPEIARAHSRRRVNDLERVLRERAIAVDQERLHHAYRKSWERCHELYWSADVDV